MSRRFRITCDVDGWPAVTPEELLGEMVEDIAATDELAQEHRGPLPSVSDWIVETLQTATIEEIDAGEH